MNSIPLPLFGLNYLPRPALMPTTAMMVSDTIPYPMTIRS
ncbi:hypothetical protein OROHE_010939 [Orobanche hederae]